MLGYQCLIDTETYQDQAADKEAKDDCFLPFEALETEERYLCIQQVTAHERQT